MVLGCPDELDNTRSERMLIVLVITRFDSSPLTDLQLLLLGLAVISAITSYISYAGNPAGSSNVILKSFLWVVFHLCRKEGCVRSFCKTHCREPRTSVDSAKPRLMQLNEELANQITQMEMDLEASSIKRTQRHMLKTSKVLTKAHMEQARRKDLCFNQGLGFKQSQDSNLANPV